MIASVLTLSREDCKTLKIKDAYSIHRVVYDLFPDVRNEEEKHSSTPSGILFADQGGDFHSRRVLILSNREPRLPELGQISSKEVLPTFLVHDHYGFQVRMNPTKRDKTTGKTVAVRGDKNINQSDQQALKEWFLDSQRQASWGFMVVPESLQIQDVGVQRFEKVSGKTVTHCTATFKGRLEVSDRVSFIRSFEEGLGRAKAFGFGLLQIVPLQNGIKIKS